MLRTEGEGHTRLLNEAFDRKKEVLGDGVWLRGLVEFSNRCAKECFYCGIRASNRSVSRYDLDDEEILRAARFADNAGYASVVLQSGEIRTEAFARRIETLVREIKKQSDGRIGITLSCGEQSPDTYRRWFEAGAHRYLLRIETTDPQLYRSIHPDDRNHSFATRLQCLNELKRIGFQTGTGVMIGLPGQRVEDLADDLLFFRDREIDMVGMGPYIEHRDTPLYERKDELLPLRERFDLSLRMIAALRLLLPEVNIAAATALQAIDPMGREKALMAGANIVMPNITPGRYRNDYRLYENKPCVDEEAEDCERCLEARITMTGQRVMKNEWGDSLRFRRRT